MTHLFVNRNATPRSAKPQLLQTTCCYKKSSMESEGIRRQADMINVATGRSSDANERRAVKYLKIWPFRMFCAILLR
jgi:hypothetical protein